MKQSLVRTVAIGLLALAVVPGAEAGDEPFAPGGDIKAPGMITTLQAEGLSQTEVVLQWIAPADDSGDERSGPAAAYEIYYSLDLITENGGPYAQVYDAAGNQPVPGDPGAEEWMAAILPQSGTLYCFAVRSVDEAGNWSPLSNVAWGSTYAPEELPPAPPPPADPGPGPEGSEEECGGSASGGGGLIAALAALVLRRR